MKGISVRFLNGSKDKLERFLIKALMLADKPKLWDNESLEVVMSLQEIYFAGGCLWGVQEYIRHLPGVVGTQAGRANGKTNCLNSEYDGYAECVKTTFDPEVASVETLMGYFFEIIDPYSVNKQGKDEGSKYRTGVYSTEEKHLEEAKAFIDKRDDSEKIVVEVLPLTNYIKSAAEHQDRLTRCPEDYCHIPKEILYKYRDSKHSK